jgi:hypothetical protein
MVYFKFLRQENELFNLQSNIRTFTRLFIPREQDLKDNYCYAEIPNGYFTLFVEQFKVYGHKLEGKTELPEGIEKKYTVITPGI